MATPIVPQRPARSRVAAPEGSIDVPHIPPRPMRSMARSVSPQRDSFARSPLNDPSVHNGQLYGSSSLSKSLTVDAPPRPPSVDFPTIGQEGHEYGQIQEHLNTPDIVEPGPQELTKAVAGDLPLHAPKASLPASAAKSKISTVTRTDSSQAAAAGIGKAHGDDYYSHILTRTSSTQPSRPTSLYSKDHAEGEEQGIPEIGLQIPLYPNAGDVQAPSPSPALFAPGTGSGLTPQNTGQASLSRHHTRTKSGRDVFIGPPGSYGMHGHGVNLVDPFEKDWYLKHPDAMKKEEQGEYGPAISEHRKDWALSSHELNKLVHSNIHSAIASTTAVAGTPAEEIGYIASEEYASRMASPRPASTQPGKERRLSGQVHTESPLRKMSLPTNEIPTVKHDQAVDSEADYEEIIHVDPISRTASRVDGRGYDQSTEDTGAHGITAEHEDDLTADDGYSAPILASDEVKYRPESQFLQPAIEPELERHDSSYLEIEPSTPPTYPSGRRVSRPGSRANSIHTLPHMSRFTTVEDRPDIGTPLEDVKEYEPLFPDDEDLEKKKSASEPNLPIGDKPQRPDLARHHFPSRDVWEDTPDSLMYETTVKTPQLPEFSIPSAEHEPKEIFETPEQEKARKANVEASDQQDFIPESTKSLAKTPLTPDVLDDTSLISNLPARHQFPSRDVWEDTADHLLHTTVITPQPDLQIQADASPEASKALPIIPARPSRTKPAALDLAGPSSLEDKKAPVIPDRPKPKVPERPSKTVARGASAEEVPLAKTASREDNSVAASKAKPAVPARPSGSSKIAALQAGFMKDLNQRLQLGPQAPKRDEPAKAAADDADDEQAPLADARKGRARGPQRRRPGSSSPAARGADEEKKVRFAIAKMVTVFEIDESGAVRVAERETAKESAALARDVLEPSGDAADEPELKASAAEAAEAETVKPIASSSSDATVQTGETKIKLPAADGGAAEDVTVYLGGSADKPGTVVDRDGEQIVGDADTQDSIERVGPGN